MDMATAGVRRRTRSPAHANSSGSGKRRKIGIDTRCATPSSDDKVSVSCCSSKGSKQTEKRKKMKKSADLEHYEDGSAEVDRSAPPHLRGDPRSGNDASSSEVEEELEEKDMDSAKATLSEERSKDGFCIPTDGHGLQLPKVEAPENMKPTKADIEDFFAVAEAQNLYQLQYFTKKYNFDFAKEEPLEGRFEWCQ